MERIPVVVDEDTEETRWYEAVYPWDMASCRRCISMHASSGCSDPEHAELSKAARAAGLTGACPSLGKTLSMRGTALKLRQEFSHLYKNNPAPSWFTRTIQQIRNWWDNRRSNE